MAVKRVRVYNTRTGNILRSTVPESHLRLFPHLRVVPSRRDPEPADEQDTQTPVPVAPVQAEPSAAPSPTDSPDWGTSSGTAALTEED